MDATGEKWACTIGMESIATNEKERPSRTAVHCSLRYKRPDDSCISDQLCVIVRITVVIVPWIKRPQEEEWTHSVWWVKDWNRKCTRFCLIAEKKVETLRTLIGCNETFTVWERRMLKNVILSGVSIRRFSLRRFYHAHLLSHQHQAILMESLKYHQDTIIIRLQLHIHHHTPRQITLNSTLVTRHQKDYISTHIYCTKFKTF